MTPDVQNINKVPFPKQKTNLKKKSSDDRAMTHEIRIREWHIVSLLGDVTSPTTAIHYVSMTSDLHVLSTEKHCPVRRQHTVYTKVYKNKSLQCKGEVHSSQLNK